MDIDNITSIKNSIILMLLAKKSPEILPKHKEYIFISESFALNCYIFVALITNKNLLLSL